MHQQQHHLSHPTMHPINMTYGQHMPPPVRPHNMPPSAGMTGHSNRMTNQHHPQQQRLAMHQQSIPPQNRANVGGMMSNPPPPPPVVQQQPLKSNPNQRTIPAIALVNNGNAAAASNNVNNTQQSVNVIANNHQHRPNLQAPPPPLPSAVAVQAQTPHVSAGGHTVVAGEQHYSSVGGRKTIRSGETAKVQEVSAKTNEPKTESAGSNNGVSSTTEDYKLNDPLPNTIAIETLANTKEKTPMCLVNELARYNKIEHQYRLTGEEGPAHKKCFTVTLKLGDEEYTAEGLSIKKAQHAAAAEAISKTKYEHPPLKTNRSIFKTKKIGTLTPTVELNALAMKRGEPTVYVAEPLTNGGYKPGSGALAYGTNSQNKPSQNYTAYIPHNIANTAAPPPPPHQSQHPPSSQGHYNNPRNNNANFHQLPPLHIQQQPPHQQQMRYNTGYERKFMGRNGYPNKYDNQRSMYGNSYRQMGPPQDETPCSVTLQVGTRKFTGIGPTVKAARQDAAAKALKVLKPLTPDTTDDLAVNESATAKLDESSSELKSPISLVHEMALKRKLSVTFKVQSEKGPPHMKIFITTCQVGDVVTEGEGNGKKVSKKKAAEKMVEELKKITPPSPTTDNLKQKRKVSIIKKKSRNLIKDKQEESMSDEINPISRLIQHQQAKKEKEPTFILIDERGAHKRREFVIEANAGGYTTTGTGPNKKMAKRAAAESLLVLMGIAMPSSTSTSPHPPKSGGRAAANKENVPKAPKKATPQESNGRSQNSPAKGGSGGRQIVPGALILQPENKSNVVTTTKPATATKTNGETAQKAEQPVKVAATSTPAASKASDGIRPKDQLLYLASVVGFTVHFSDFPKGNHGEYLTIVTLTTEPQQYCHGAGNSTEASHDQAAATALALLTQLGLDNVVPKKTADD